MWKVISHVCRGEQLEVGAEQVTENFMYLHLNMHMIFLLQDHIQILACSQFLQQLYALHSNEAVTVCILCSLCIALQC